LALSALAVVLAGVSFPGAFATAVNLVGWVFLYAYGVSLRQALRSIADVHNLPYDGPFYNGNNKPSVRSLAHVWPDFPIW
jgi:hypothetical protein